MRLFFDKLAMFIEMRPKVPEVLQVACHGSMTFVFFPWKNWSAFFIELRLKASRRYLTYEFRLSQRSQQGKKASGIVSYSSQRTKYFSRRCYIFYIVLISTSLSLSWSAFMFLYLCWPKKKRKFIVKKKIVRLRLIISLKFIITKMKKEVPSSSLSFEHFRSLMIFSIFWFYNKKFRDD